MNTPLRRRMLSLLIALTMVLSMVPSMGATDSRREPSAALLDLARQLQDDQADPFDFRIGEGMSNPRLFDGPESYPDAFDLRNVDTDGDGKGDTSYVTPVKLQNPFGSCWGFAAIAAAETSILGSGLGDAGGYAAAADPAAGRRELNLSEKHLAFFLNQTIDDPDDSQYGEGIVFTGTPGSSDIYNTGGFPFYATGLFAAGTGPVLESWNPQMVYRGKNSVIQYASTGEPFCYSKEDDWQIDSDYRWYQDYVLKESFILPTPSGKTGDNKAAAINAIKDQISSKRAVQIGFCADTSKPDQTEQTKYISENWAHYTYEKVGANHAVTIIGWDDHYPRENFAHKTTEGQDAPLPEQDGAWLVKNSWGSGERVFPNKGRGWGLLQGQDHGVYNSATGKYEYNAVENAVNTGYFWLSYEDQSICMVEALDFDAVNALEGYWMYEYDYMPVSTVDAGLLSNTVRMANVFDVEETARLELVSCQTAAPDTLVEYDVYLLADDFANPMDGKLISHAEETYQYGGFHKATLDTPVVLNAGQHFSVVITQKTPDNLYSFSIQRTENKNFAEYYAEKERKPLPDYARGIINENESLFLLDDEWYDLSDQDIQKWLKGENAEYYDLDNFPIKAYLAVLDEPEPPTPAGPFVDVPEGEYYYEPIYWALEQGITTSSDKTHFSPDESCTRGQVVTFLWRAAGQPDSTDASLAFTDVAPGDYCYEAVRWAAETGITKGTEPNRFSPNQTVTRAQAVTFLYRYIKLAGGGFTDPWSFALDYSDTADVPEYAYEPFCWTTMQKIIQGYAGKLSPNDTCIRAQIVTMLYRAFSD